MQLADREWRLIREEARPGPMQMALDEVAAATAADGGPRTVRVYRWEPSCLTLGYNQSPDTVDWAFCDREGIDVTRRATGGGGIYHDRDGDVAYSVAVPAEEVPGDLLDCYHLLCEPILEAFARLDVDVDFAEESYPELHEPACYLRELHPAHDMVAGGRKLAGNAQYRQDDAVIQHGSLSFDVDAERHLGVFADPPVDPAGFRDRVTAVAEHADATRSEAVTAVEGALADWADATEGSWTEAELVSARELVREKYRDDDWVRRRTDDR